MRVPWAATFGPVMACSVHVAQEAENDLVAIVDYLCNTLFSPTAADELLGAYETFIDVVEGYPQAYPLSADRHLASLGYRKAQLKSYVALYRIDGDGVVISRIFHQSQDYARLV